MSNPQRDFPDQQTLRAANDDIGPGHADVNASMAQRYEHLNDAAHDAMVPITTREARDAVSSAADELRVPGQPHLSGDGIARKSSRQPLTRRLPVRPEPVLEHER